MEESLKLYFKLTILTGFLLGNLINIFYQINNSNCYETKEILKYKKIMEFLFMIASIIKSSFICFFIFRKNFCFIYWFFVSINGMIIFVMEIILNIDNWGTREEMFSLFRCYFLTSSLILFEVLAIMKNSVFY